MAKKINNCHILNIFSEYLTGLFIFTIPRRLKDGRKLRVDDFDSERDKIRVDHNGQRLVLLSVQSSDGGKYECRVTDGRTTINRTLTVHPEGLCHGINSPFLCHLVNVFSTTGSIKNFSRFKKSPKFITRPIINCFSSLLSMIERQ